ncbi:hypothetical protein BDN72DRAFT_682897 [Pluteus cervinus]|uniref:Uncharacterized protein n=1 Tax=Pluteus cervinus TaxID=181527 RepID=A0ACD3AQU6_9AGAR|nr:hypothetical protein BDN72DRAFT_682897 [Pluteus cervinus]
MSVTEFAKLRGEQRLEDLRDSTTHLGGGGGGNQDTPPTGSGGGESSTSTDSNSGTALDDLPIKTTVTDFIKALLVDVIAFQVYHALMLRLPGLYWVRIIRLFEHAEKSLPDVAILLAGPHPHDSDTGMTSIGGSDMTATAHHGRVHEIPVGVRARPFRFRTGTTYTLSNLDRKQEPLSYKKMKDSWNNFIEALLSEWATFNILTVLLLSAIIAILQIDAAAQDIIIRTSALISLVFAFLSLLFGCIYIGRFHEMRKPYKGAHWAWQVAKIRGTNLFWNAWVFLAMPAVFLAWSLVAFIICMLAYVWRTGDPTQDAPPPFTKQALLGSRIAVTAVLGIGCIYLIFGGMKFREYEAMYQESTHRIIKQWLEQNPQLDGGDEDDSLGEGEEVKDLQLMRVNDVRLTTSPSPWQSEQYLGDSDASDIEHHPNHPYSGHQATTGDNRQVRFEHRHPGGADPPKSILKSQLRPSVPITNTPRPLARPSEKAASAGILIQVVPPPLTGVGIKKPGASKPLDPANSKLISRNFKDALFSTPSRPIMPPTPVSPGWLKIAALVRFQLLRHPQVATNPLVVGSLRGVGPSYS